MKSLEILYKENNTAFSYIFIITSLITIFLFIFLFFYFSKGSGEKNIKHQIDPIILITSLFGSCIFYVAYGIWNFSNEIKKGEYSYGDFNEKIVLLCEKELNIKENEKIDVNKLYNCVSEKDKKFKIDLEKIKQNKKIFTTNENYIETLENEINLKLNKKYIIDRRKDILSIEPNLKKELFLVKKCVPFLFNCDSDMIEYIEVLRE